MEQQINISLFFSLSSFSPPVSKIRKKKLDEKWLRTENWVFFLHNSLMYKYKSLTETTKKIKLKIILFDQHEIEQDMK